MYDQNGVELHKMASHIEPLRLEFLPYHFLLASIGLTGVLTYQDTSTGSIVAMHKTKGNGAGNSLTMCQNKHNAIIYLGHSNGTVSLWSPNMSESVVRVLAHRGGVKSVVVDESVAGGGMNGGRYMATAGLDGMVKVWDCRNWKGCVREWSARGGAAELDWSAKGVLAVASGGTVNVSFPRRHNFSRSLYFRSFSSTQHHHSTLLLEHVLNLINTQSHHSHQRST